MQDFISHIYQIVAAYVPNLLGALAILILGWVASLLVADATKRIIQHTYLKKKLSEWISKEGEKPLPVELYFSKIVFYILMLFVLVAFFQTLGLTIVTKPLNNLLNQVFIYAPKFFGAILLLVTAWIIATILRFVTKKSLTSLKLDEQLTDKTEGEIKSVELTNTIANSVYWLVFLLFLPAILNSLQLGGLLEPVESMLNKILTYLPNIFTAGLVLLVGWFVAKIVRNIITNLLAAVGINTLSEKVGLATVLGKEKLSDALGLIAYILILLPVLLASLDALKLESITAPVSNMLNLMLKAIPLIFAASLVVFVSYVVGKLVSKLVSNLLESIGFDNFVAKLGVMEEANKEKNKASDVVGYLTLASIVFIGLIEAFDILGLKFAAEMATGFTVFAGNVILGLVIFGFGLYFSNIISNRILTKETTQLKLMAFLSRVGILFVTGAMALQQMGIGSDIIKLAFGLILGAIAIATAIAFGIGGRDIAARYLEKWSEEFENKKEE